MTTSMTWCRGTSAVLGAALAVLIAAAPAYAADDAGSPKAVVQSTAEQVIAILKDKAVPVDQRLDRLQQIAYQRFDFPTICRLVLARGWNQLSPEQRNAFLEDFKRHLSLDYGRRIDSYTNQTVAVLGDRMESNGDATVRTQVVGVNGGAGVVSVDYRLRKIDGQWLVIDIIVEGVSLVSSYRSQFQEIMASGGATRLLEVLREKNTQAENAQASAS